MDFTVYVPVTTIAAILNGALLVLMTGGIGLIRNKTQVSYGDAGDARFAKRVRGHANGVEQIPIALVLILLAELQGASDGFLIVVVVALTLGRIFHAVQFWFVGTPFILRPIGVVLTLLAQLLAIIWLVAAMI